LRGCEQLNGQSKLWCRRKVDCTRKKKYKGQRKVDLEELIKLQYHNIITFTTYQPFAQHHPLKTINMRFSTIAISALAGLAAAAPNGIAKRESQQMTNVIEFAAQQADCSIFDCAAVIGAGICIAAGLATVPVGVAAVVACVSGGAPSVFPPILFPTLTPLTELSFAAALDASTLSVTS
jgi:hypothetical protein